MKALWQILTNPDIEAPRWLRWIKRLLSIRASILLVYLIVVGGGFYAIMGVILQEIQPRYLESMEESLVDTANILAALVEQEIEAGKDAGSSIETVFDRAYSRRFAARIYSLEKRSVDLRVYLTDAMGLVIFDSVHPDRKGADYSKWRDVRLTLGGEYGARASWLEEAGESILVLYVGAPIRVEGRIAGAITVGKPTTYINEMIDRAERRFLVYIVASAIAVLALGFVLSIWLTRPIKQLIGYATAIRDGKPSDYPRMFGMEANNLGRAFEQMREALEGKQYIERYVQSLTHQIKSPLSGISGAAELLESDMTDEERTRFTGNISREAERIRRIVDRLLELSSVESRRGLQNVEEFSLVDIVKEVVLDIRPLLLADGLECVVEASDAASIRGERFLARQAIANVVQNAIEFSPVGATIRIGVVELESAAEVFVADEGPGVPEYALDRVCERFYSLSRPKTGEKSSGIGLSFVKEIMALHRGSFAIENLDQGGAVARLRFPLR